MALKCPILTAARAADRDCRENCAWLIDDQCAIVIIACSLDQMNKLGVDVNIAREMEL